MPPKEILEQVFYTIVIASVWGVVMLIGVAILIGSILGVAYMNGVAL